MSDESHELGLMDLADEMKLKIYGAYMNRQDVDTVEYHGKALDYLEGDRQIPPLGWEDAMSELEGEVYGEEL